MPATPAEVTVSFRNITPKTASKTTWSFQMATETEIAPYLKDLESRRVDITWVDPARKEQSQYSGPTVGNRATRLAARAKGSRKKNLPQTFMYSSRLCPRSFITAFLPTWTSAEARENSHHIDRIHCNEPKPTIQLLRSKQAQLYGCKLSTIGGKIILGFLSRVRD